MRLGSVPRLRLPVIDLRRVPRTAAGLVRTASRPHLVAATACLAVAALYILPSSVFADRNGNGALLLHAAPEIAHSLGDTPPSDPPVWGCESVKTEAGTDAPTLWFVLASFPPAADPYVRKVRFGLRYDETALEILESGFTLADAVLEYGWPSSGSFARTSYMVPHEESFFQVAWFYGGSIDGREGVFEFDTDRGAWFDSDDSSAPVARFGALGFGQPGDAPCNPGACCIEAEPYCSFVAEERCLELGGLFLGVDVPCGRSGCEPGLCCYGLDCELTRKVECIERGGEFVAADPAPGAPCESYCVQPIEKMSWGQIRSIFRTADEDDEGSRER